MAEPAADGLDGDPGAGPVSSLTARGVEQAQRNRAYRVTAVLPTPHSAVMAGLVPAIIP